MSDSPDDKDPEIPPIALSIGKLFGLSPTQTRWKLLAMHRRWRAAQRELAPASRTLESQICGECGAVQPREAKACSSCGAKLASPVAHFLRTLGLSIPTFVSVSSLLGLAMILIYFRMMMEWSRQGIFSWTMEALITHGGLWPPAVFQGQAWRLGTANFLHIGVMHIFFNMTGLMQVGPMVEETFGRARMVFFFIVTGVFAMGASALLMPATPTAGASGALMGLIGITAAWGHRRKTTQGREVRDQMLKWGVYTMIFGLIVNANHVAHGGGFAVGAALGFAFRPERLEKTKGSAASMIMGIVGGLGCAACVLLAMAPPASSRALAAAFRPPTAEGRASEAAIDEPAMRDSLRAACRAHAEGAFNDGGAPTEGDEGDAASLAEFNRMCEDIKRIEARCDVYREGGAEKALTAEEKADPERQITIEGLFELFCGSPPPR